MGLTFSSATLQQAVEAALRYLGVKGAKRVTTETVQAVQADGTLQTSDGHALRTSGPYVGMRAGQEVPILWSRQEGNRRAGVVPAGILASQQRPGTGAAPPRPAVLQLGPIIEVLYVADLDGGTFGPFDIWFRNDQQITRLNLTALFPEGTNDYEYTVKWGVSGDSFLVIHNDLVSLPTFYIFTLDRDPHVAYGTRQPKVTLLRTEPWRQVTVATYEIVVENMDGVDVFADVGSSGRYYDPSGLHTDGTPVAPSAQTNDVSVETAGTGPIAVRLLNEAGDALDVALVDGALTADRHVLVTVQFGLTVDWLRPGATLHRKRWAIAYEDPPRGGTFEDVDSPLDPALDLLVDYAPSTHAALIDLTTGDCLWASTGGSLSIILGGSFRRPYRGTGLDEGAVYFDYPTFLAKAVEADAPANPFVETVGYATDLTTYPATLPSYVNMIGSVNLGEIGLTAGSMSAVHGMSFVPLDGLTFESMPLRVENLRPGLTLRPGEGPVVAVADTFRPLWQPFSETPDQRVIELTGTLLYARVPVVDVSVSLLFPSSLAYDVRLAIVVKRTDSTGATGQLAAFVIDGTGRLIMTLRSWRPFTSPLETIGIYGGNARHVMWGERPDTIHLARYADPDGGGYAGAVAPFTQAGAVVLRPDYLYGATETVRRLLVAWNYQTGIVSVDPAHPVTADTALATASPLKNLPRPAPFIWIADYHAVDTVQARRRLGIPADVL